MVRTCDARRLDRLVLPGGRRVRVLLGVLAGAAVLVVFAMVRAPDPISTASGSSAPQMSSTGCPLRADAQRCWEQKTGVPGWSGDEIVAGRSPLTVTHGDLEITEDGAILRDHWVDGCIAVKASHVTIERVLVRSDHGCVGGLGPAAPALISTGENGGGGISDLVVRDTEIDGLGATGDTIGIGQTEYSCTRCKIVGTAKGAKADQDVSVVDSYINDLAHDGATHTEPFFFDGGRGRIEVRGSWMRANDDHSTAAVALINDWPGSQIVIAGNYLDGNGSVAIVGGSVRDKAAPGMEQVVIENNVLRTRSDRDASPLVHSFDASGPGNRWSANNEEITGDLVAPP